MDKKSFRDYRKEAAAEAVSFIEDGYRRIGECYSSYRGWHYIYLRHTRNGNAITISVTPDGYKIHKNNELIKSEPI